MSRVNRSKYGAKKVIVGSRTYDSKAEALRAVSLRLELSVGAISDLRYQVAYELAQSVIVAGRKRPPLRYVADFVYIRDGVEVVEDVKGMVTAVYRIKRHLMKSVHGIDILETK